MRPAFGNRHDMVYLFNGSKAAFLQAELAERVLLCIAVANALPCPAILFIDVGSAFIPIVLPSFASLMLGAVLSVSQVGTATYSARMLRPSRQTESPPTNKSPADFIVREALCGFPLIIIVS